MADVFGMVLLDAADGKDAIHEIERDDGYVDESLGKQYVAEFKEWLEGQQEAVGMVKGRVLDIGCGAGRVSIYLQNQGHEVTGIDASPGAVKASRNRGVEDVRLMNAENLEFTEGVFDTAIMFGNNFGILGHPDRVVDMLRRLHDITSPEALILAESRNPLTTDNPVHLAYHEQNRDKGNPPGLVKIRLRYKGATGDWWQLLLATPALMKSIAERAGWRVSEILGDESIYVGVLEKQ